jgi:NAD-dependent deacetylase
MPEIDELISEAASVLSRARHAIAFSGAGVSAESGVSTFRDVGGLWERLDPIETASTSGLINALQNNADMLIGIFVELLDAFEKAEPNAGHKALGRMEQEGMLKAVITQNVDDLHRESGNTNVIEIHGNVFRMRCIGCGARTHFDRKPLIREVREKLGRMTDYSLPNLISLAQLCAGCGMPMRPDVVMFGEAVQQMPEAYLAARNSDVMLVLGTSGVIYPAADLPIQARAAGARLIEINPGGRYFARDTDIHLPLKSGEALPAIMARLVRS